jgi:hypothetical protein
MSEDVCSFFQRNRDGSWTTLRAVTITHGPRLTELPAGQILAPGAVVAGFAVVK